MNNINKRHIININKIIIISLYSLFIIRVNPKKIIKIDNEINESLYKENLDFSRFKTKHKVVAIYYPDNCSNKIENVKKKNKTNNYNSLIEYQIKLAKMHGIYGFGVVYNWTNNKIYDELISNLFSYMNDINFPFFIILNYDMKYSLKNETSLKQNITNNDIIPCLFMYYINNFIRSNNYIKFKGNPIIGIFHSQYITYKFINDIRKSGYEYDQSKVFILYISNEIHDILNYPNETNYLVEFTSQNIGLPNNRLNQQYYYNFYYYNLFKEENIKTQTIQKFCIINGSELEKFYLMLAKYLNCTCQNNDTFILFNAWNNYKDNYFLEPNDEYGFSYLNYFSKALFNINHSSFYELKLSNDGVKIAIQVHLFYEDLIADIINKVNNIPVKYDLYITTTSESLATNLENYIKEYSNTNKYEILIAENKGRDVLPFLTQMKDKYKKYKYLSHIHSKKSQTAPQIGFVWRNYLYDNLFGNTNIISKILYDFENDRKLGFIFPEAFYGIIQHFFRLTNKTIGWMNFLSSKYFPEYERGELVNFPAGNMFWAKTKAIYQVFIYNFTELYPSEDDQTNDTIMHGIERIWLYLVKYNHFKYKVIFNSF